MSKKRKKRKVQKKLKEPKTNSNKLDGIKKYFCSGAVGGIIGRILFSGTGGVVIGSLLGIFFETLEEKDRKMAKIPVFYSFHFDNDVMRVQLIRNIGSIEGNAPTSPNEWETLKRSGDKAVENWIDQNMKYKRCVIVLIGSETANRPWVEHEITKAWNDGKALLGIYIHNIKCPRNGTSRKGKNPFDKLKLKDGRKLSNFVPCYDPSSTSAYTDIAANISQWINDAINNKAN
jgi:hypothetical protein